MSAKRRKFVFVFVYNGALINNSELLAFIVAKRRLYYAVEIIKFLYL